ncbi:MAG: BREX-2 system adenine-specific DNA-methyltransferase PglX [Planctomycetaceae bacterium]|nr:BREX-2 system adenine-specific DNA-methyltransferase PglX [Planctomycetaceae bacterium]
MINRQALLADLQKFLQRIEADLLERSESTEVPEVPAALHAEYEKAAKAERTAQNYEDWRTDTITQAAAAWVLSCVFVRFLEDNSLIDPPKIAGPGERLARARDEHELYFRSHPQHTDREYLLSIFGELAKLPGTKGIFGEHNAINDLPNWLSGDAAGELLNFFQKIDASTGELVHDFTDPNWDTRFLGDLYQDLSEAARKKFALLQTPDFVEEFILDRTLEPALDEFGLVTGHSSLVTGQSRATNDEGQMTNDYFKMIDPACGSGHFLLGPFPRLLDRWQRREPGTNIRELAQRALNSIHGVDINPFAVAIAKFRLLLVAMKSCDIRRLADAPAFQINVTCGDSLLHGENRTSTGQNLMDFAEGATDQELYAHAYPGEDLHKVRTLLRPSTYHCVVANPPYIVPKDRKLNDWYRKRFPNVCHRQYSLAVPFMQQIFQLAVPSGFTGQITANSFMKREFGKKLIESFFPTVDLTYVIDTSGAYIPGHGTPTTILFGRNREPVGSKLRTVLGIRGEPSTPADPAKGLVWSAIVSMIDEGFTNRRNDAKGKKESGTLASFASSRNTFVSVGDSDRSLFHKHPWSIGGGGASELKEQLEEYSETILNEAIDTICSVCLTRADDIYLQPKYVLTRQQIPRSQIVSMVEGEQVRDWGIDDRLEASFPYDNSLSPVAYENGRLTHHFLWTSREILWRRRELGGDHRELNRTWWEWNRFLRHRYAIADSITYPEVATHNHFVFDRGGKVFKQTAPVIKLPSDATEDDHLALLGLLNSSTACFWMKQVCFPKGGDHVGQEGARVRRSLWDERYAFNGTNIEKLPLPEGRPLDTTKHLDQLAQALSCLQPGNVLTQWRKDQKMYASPAALLPEAGRGEQDDELCDFAPLRETLSASRIEWELTRQQMIAAQENLDWECYRLYALIDEVLSEQNSATAVPSLLPLSLGQRAFEIVLARKITAGETQSTWFERHGSTPITELPAHWPEEYKRLVERRIELIENDPNIRLIEQPEYKRRWNTEPWESQLERALREWLLLRLETYFDFDGRMTDETSAITRPVPLREIAMYSVARLADAARRDPQFMEVGELYRDDPAFDIQALVEELVLAENVPHLPILRYKDSGLRKRAEWEKTWDLQREEDRLDALRAVVLQELSDAQERVRTTFTAESAELEQKRAQLLELTAQAYREAGKEVPALGPAEPAELHANALFREVGRKKLTDSLVAEIESAMSEISDYESAVEGKIKAACNEDPAVRSARSRLQEIPPPPKIPVPPKYTSADFISTGGARYWALRGKLDVPKERWISFPHCEGPDGTLIICWAGYDHLQQAQAISSYYVRVQTEFGGSDDPRLVPLLASLTELLPWLKQWHNDPNPNFDGLRMGDYFEGFVNEEARNLGKTLDEIKAWLPSRPVTATKARRGLKPTGSKKRSVEAKQVVED